MPTFAPLTVWRSLRLRLAHIGLDGFILALVAAIGLAALYPAPGLSWEPVSLGEVASYGVTLIFFFYGLRLSPAKLRAGLRNWRLHVVVHVATFLIFPLFPLAAYGLVPALRDSLLWLGVFYLAALPSTVSSSVVMVGLAGGNLPGAIFNASVSALIGVLVTPLWMGLFLQARTADYDLGGVILSLLFQVLLPVVLGAALHHRYGGWAERHRGRLKTFDQTIILLIVYTSFCDSFANDLFAPLGLGQLLLLGGLMLALLGAMYAIITGLSRGLGFDRGDRITALFCGSKKSLVHGTVMARLLFPEAEVLGLVLLPLMLYHTLQLIVASMLAQRMGRQLVS